MENEREKDMNIDLPDHCPVCGGRLEILESKDGIRDLYCVNSACPARSNEAMAAFLDRLGVMGVSNATLMEWGLHSMEDLASFRADPRYRSQTKFLAELDRRLWTATYRQLALALSAFVPGVGRKEMEKFYDKVGLDLFVEGWNPGPGSSVKEKAIVQALPLIRRNYLAIFADQRWKDGGSHQDPSKSVQSVDSGKSICFTGRLETMGRSEAQARAKSLGYSIADGVSRGLSVLVVADASLSGAKSSKLKKAEKLGVKVMSESEFRKLVDGTETEVG